MIQKMESLITFLQDKGVIVIISMLTPRADELKSKALNFNKLLLNLCARFSVSFIDHTTILLSDLDNFGLHVNKNGTNFL